MFFDIGKYIWGKSGTEISVSSDVQSKFLRELLSGSITIDRFITRHEFAVLETLYDSKDFNTFEKYIKGETVVIGKKEEHSSLLSRFSDAQKEWILNYADLNVGPVGLALEQLGLLMNAFSPNASLLKSSPPELSNSDDNDQLPKYKFSDVRTTLDPKNSDVMYLSGKLNFFKMNLLLDDTAVCIPYDRENISRSDQNREDLSVDPLLSLELAFVVNTENNKQHVTLEKCHLTSGQPVSEKHDCFS